MAVYVDGITDYGDRVKGQARRHGTRWSHMTADSREELDRMAVRIGLKTAWRQHSGRPTEHYDLIPFKRQMAIGLGAIEVTTREMFARAAEAHPSGLADAERGI